MSLLSISLLGWRLGSLGHLSVKFLLLLCGDHKADGWFGASLRIADLYRCLAGAEMTS